MNRPLTLKVAAIERETDDAVTIHLKQPLLRKVRYSAGQYLTLEVDVDGAKGCRAYSISSTPGLDKTLSITVKRVAGGKVSNRLVQELSAGDAVQTLGTHGRFTFAPQPGRGGIWCCWRRAAGSRRSSRSSSRRCTSSRTRRCR